MISDTLLGGEELESSHSSLITSVGLSTLGNVDGGLTSLAGETESPAAGRGTTLLSTIVKSGDALGILLAGGPLVGTLGLDTLLRG